VTLYWLVLAGLGVAAWFAAEPWLREFRRRRLRARPLSEAQRTLLRRLPLYRRLPPRLQAELRGHLQVFLAEKRFVGCAGLAVTDLMRVTIAAQACLLMLGRDADYFPFLREVLVYPSAFVVERLQADPNGVHTHLNRTLSGESSSNGQVVLSWDDALEGARDGDDGRNVVIHDFAHQLDQEFGPANGAPLLATRADYARWSDVLAASFESLRRQLAAGLPTLLDPYGAQDPAEFFAVACEVFFERGEAMARVEPALYGELRRYFGVDPAAWG